MRVTDKYAVYSEINSKDYVTEYGKMLPSWYHTRTPNDSFTPAGPDFHYPYRINEMGFRDKNYPLERNDSTFRILVTGDSYAEGVGAGYDSTWPRLFDERLFFKHLRAEVIDAGVAGSDIVYDYTFYRDKLNTLNPMLVMASFNSSDFNDYVVRGGMERFYADGTTHTKPLPWYFFFYKNSRLVRALFHKIGGFNNTGLFISQRQFDKSCIKAALDFADVFAQYQAEALKHHSYFVAVLHVIPGEIMEPQKEIYAANIRGLDTLASLLKAKGVPYINLSPELNKRFS
ncbi:MAG: lipolytic protein family, partial [Bacteroidota bacterium]|nr:lipolytic protein family [Bacteroidota bacterium]